MSTAQALPTASPPPFAWHRAWVLIVLSLAVVVLAAIDVLPTWPGLVHLVALPPLDLFTDLRLIIALAPSWPVAVISLVAVLGLRITLMAYLMGGLSRATLGLATRFYALVILPVTGAAAASTIAATMPQSAVFWTAVGVLGLVSLVSAAVPWQGTTRLRSAIRRSFHRGPQFEVLLTYAAVAVALGWVAHLVEGLTLPFVPLSALATALAIYFFQRPPVRPVLIGSVTVASAVAAGAAVVFLRLPDPPVQEASRQEGSLLLMAGIDSSSGTGTILQTDPEQLGYTCDQVHYFSYAGPGDGQPQGHAECPNTSGAPYEREDTQRSLDELVEIFAEQTQDLPRPLVVAGHSNAVWVAWEAAARGEAEVDVLSLVGPMPDSPAGYPPPGEDGPGRVLGDMLRLVEPAGTLIDYEPSPDAPQAQELQAVPNASREIFSRPLPEEVRVLSVMAVRDLAIMPGGWRLDVERNACPVLSEHSDLPVTNEYTEELIRFLDGQPGPECSVWLSGIATLAVPFGPAPGGG